MNRRARSRLPVMTAARLAGMALGRLGLVPLGTLALLSALSHAPPGTGVPVAMTCRSGGGVLTLTAMTEKRGVACVDSWSVSPSLALALATVLEDEGRRRAARYVSTARVCARLASDTTYTFGYSIVMKTSGATWAGSGRIAITTGADGAITSCR